MEHFERSINSARSVLRLADPPDIAIGDFEEQYQLPEDLNGLKINSRKRKRAAPGEEPPVNGEERQISRRVYYDWLEPLAGSQIRQS